MKSWKIILPTEQNELKFFFDELDQAWISEQIFGDGIDPQDLGHGSEVGGVGHRPCARVKVVVVLAVHSLSQEQYWITILLQTNPENKEKKWIKSGYIEEQWRLIGFVFESFTNSEQ